MKAPCLLLALLVTAAGPTPLRPSKTEIPFRHALIDSANVGADCKAVGDLDGDGYPDVAVADDTGIGLQWYRYPGWSKHVIDPRSVFTTDMQTGDVDGDGDLDLIVPDIKANVMLWYENPRPGGNPARDAWKVHTLGPPYGHDVEVGDVNHDGRLDVVARNGDTTVFLQKSPNVWESAVIRTGLRGGTALGDLDRDGDLDLAQNGYWLECPKDPAKDTWTRHEVAKGWPDDIGVAVADLDGDRRPDLLLAPAEEAGRLSWYAAPTDPKRGTWTERIIDKDVSHVHTFKVADMDRDGDPDVVTAEMEQSPKKRVTVYLNLGKATAWRPQILSTQGSHNIRVADIGGDGDMDVVGANFGITTEAYSPVELWKNLLRSPKTSGK